MALDYKGIRNNKTYLFDSLRHSVSYCNLCQRMCGRKKVLSELNGNINSKVLFIAEAPGRLGAECTGIPLFGDKTGDNFEALLGNIGWTRNSVFITNAILCNPQDGNGNNSTPTKEEVQNCSIYLQMTLNLVNPDMIVTLGVKALESLKYIQSHKYTLGENVGESLSWNGYRLYPLYHMSPRALIHRNLAKQRGDFIKLSHLVDPISGLKKATSTKNKNKPVKSGDSNNACADILQYIVFNLHSISMFRATKLMYLADLRSLERTGSTISNSIYLRMQDGPWIPTLKNIAEDLGNKRLLATTFKGKKAYYTTMIDECVTNLSPEQKNIIDEVIEKYKDCTDSRLKSYTYLTKPMKYILKEEKAGRNMLKVPVIYQNNTVIQLDKDK